jgi:sodium-dependent dicarboxylate transporter 2/3/5
MTNSNSIEENKQQVGGENAIEESVEAKKLMKGFLISLTYSSSIGGSGSLVGSTPNLILKGFYDEYLPKAGMNFFTYMLYALPSAIIMVIFTWLVLSFIWIPRRFSFII